MSKRIALAAFIAAVVVQVLILIAIPARNAMTLSRGRTVVLKVQPVDPYSILGGYYVTLGYEFTRRSAFPPEPEFADGEQLYAVIERGADDIWHPVTLQRQLPVDLPDNQAVIAGKLENGQRIMYGIENFYIPEARRTAIADDLRKNADKAVVDVKLDESGHAALQRLRIEGRVYE